MVIILRSKSNLAGPGGGPKRIEVQPDRLAAFRVASRRSDWPAEALESPILAPLDLTTKLSSSRRRVTSVGLQVLIGEETRRDRPLQAVTASRSGRIRAARPRRLLSFPSGYPSGSPSASHRSPEVNRWFPTVVSGWLAEPELAPVAGQRAASELLGPPSLHLTGLQSGHQGWPRGDPTGESSRFWGGRSNWSATPFLPSRRLASHVRHADKSLWLGSRA